MGPFAKHSINSNIPDEKKSVKYSSVGDAIQKILSLPLNSYTAKTDISDAFCLFPIKPSEYPKLGMKFRGKYYYDRNLPQGCGSSCQIFEVFSTAIQAIFEHYVPDARCVHMMDDYFIIATNYTTCNNHLQKLLQICQDIGVPMAPDKTTSPSLQTTFLGIKLDTHLQVARLPRDKIEEYANEVEATLSRRKIKKKELESLIGKLNFAASVVPARPFLRRLINMLKTVDNPTTTCV